MRWLYNILFSVGFCLSGPLRLLKIRYQGKWDEDRVQRLGRYSARLKQAITNRQVMWLHVAGPEGVNACTQLIRAIQMRAPTLTVVVSTSKPACMAVLERKLPSPILRIYSPIDRRRWVQRAFAVLQPCAVLLVGAEMWPNFLWQARKRRVPVFLLSLPVARPFFSRYELLPALFRPLFASLAGVACGTEEEARTMRSLGCRDQGLRVIGEVEDSAAELGESRFAMVPDPLAELGVPAGARVLVGSQTHGGEEAMLAEAFKRLQPRFPGLFLVVVPRRRERAGEAGRDIRACGVKCVFRTEVTTGRQWQGQEVECLVVNMTGELGWIQRRASVVFMGKSLGARGGHNPLDAALMAKPIVFGPNMQDYEDISQKLLTQQGAFQVVNVSELEVTLARLLSDARLARESGRAAQRVAKEHLGWVERVMEMLFQHLKDKEVYTVQA